MTCDNTPRYCEHCKGVHRIEEPESAWSCIRSIGKRLCDSAEEPSPPVVSGLPTIEDIAKVYKKTTGHDGMRSGLLAITSFVRSRVVVEKPEPPTREEVEKVMVAEWRRADYGFAREAPLVCQGLADAILAAFGPRLRRQLSEKEWAAILSDAYDKNIEDSLSKQSWSIAEARAVLAQLAELEQPVAPPSIRDTPNGGQEVGESLVKEALERALDKAEAKMQAEHSRPHPNLSGDYGPNNPVVNPTDAIEERAKMMFRVVYPNSEFASLSRREKDIWLAVAHYVESEIRAAKRALLCEMESYFRRHNLPGSAIMVCKDFIERFESETPK